MDTKFKNIEFQPTGDISADATEFYRLCRETGVEPETTKFLENEARDKLGSNFSFFFLKENVGKEEIHHYVFLTSVAWDTANEENLLKFLNEIMHGSRHDGVRALLYVYSSSRLSEKLSKYLKLSRT